MAKHKFLVPFFFTVTFALIFVFVDNESHMETSSRSPETAITRNFVQPKLLPERGFTNFSSYYGEVKRPECSSCAVVFSSGHLINSSAGGEIDRHSCVIRFNDAPTTPKYQTDVGRKTTIRFLSLLGATNLAAEHGRFAEMTNEFLPIIGNRHDNPTRSYRNKFRQNLFGYLVRDNFENFLKAEIVKAIPDLPQGVIDGWKTKTNKIYPTTGRKPFTTVMTCF